MSIYKPVSSVNNALMSVGGSVLSGISGAIGNSIGGKVGGLVSKATSNGMAGTLAQGLANTAIRGGSAEVSRYLTAKAQNFANKMDGKIISAKNQLLNTFGFGIFSDGAINQDSLLLAGNLSMQDLYHIWNETRPDNLSRKNFYVLEINDRSGAAPVSKDGSKFSKFNLLTTNLSFGSCEVAGEALDIGSIVIDKITGTVRTEMTLTVIDDDLGSIKQWAEAKFGAVSQSNGLFMPPIYHVFDVRVVFSSNVADSAYYNQTYIMRVASMTHELSRDSAELEQVNLQFIQYDTCMPPLGA